MADVTEVIHKISYEVNDDALINATKAIQNQIVELNRLSKALNGYAKELNNLSSNESKQFDKLSGKISNTLNSIEKSFNQTQGIVAQFGRGLLKSIDISDGVESLVAKYLHPLKDELDKVGTTGTISFSKIGKSLTSFTSLIDIGINIVVVLANKFTETTKRVDTLKETLEEAKDVISDFADIASRELGKANTLFEVINNTNTSYGQKKQAIIELRNEYGSYLQNLTDEEILAGKVGKAYDNIINSIYKKAKLQAFQNKYNKLIAREVELQEQIDILKPTVPKSSGVKYEVVKSGPFKGKRVEVFEYAPWNTDQIKASNKIKELQLEQNKIIADRVKYFEKIKELLVDITPTVTSNNTSQQKQVAQQKQQRIKSDTTYIEPRKQQYLTSKIEQPELAERPIVELEEKQKGLTDKQKENIKKGIDGYQALAKAAADAYNTIIQAQIDALDKEISIREKRVESAKKLAERGNTEVLKLEEDRLRKAEQKRAEFAKRQQAINAAITVSNAIAAVARAALEGGGFGSAATIAALIAALAAGYSAVTSLSNDGGDAFADGVVGYQGKGGPRDDKNWVRISSGESIITADGTQRNRSLLEAINKGAAFSMLGLPDMPMLKPPTGISQQNNYATTKDLGSLEKKLDDVVYAIEGNKLKQNIFFDEQGVGIMTEKAINKNRKRWK